MIFAYTVDKVVEGIKSQTRRLIKPNEQLDANQQRVISLNNRTVYEVGKSYAVQPGRGKKAVARIRLTGIRCETVANISDADAHAEGFLSRQAFIHTWYSIHGKTASLQQPVWVLEFELCAIAAPELKELYDNRRAKNRSAYHSHDLSPALKGLSGTNLYSRHNERWSMDTSVSN